MLIKNITYHTDQTMAPDIPTAHLQKEQAFSTEYSINISDIFITVTANISKFNTTTQAPYDTSEPIDIIRLSLCALGLLLNLFSMLAVAHIPSEKNNHIKLIMSLAVSDTLFIISVLLHYLQQLLPHVPECQSFWVRQFLNICVNATLINLLAMAVDHYLAIMMPLRYPQLMSSVRSNIMIFMIWFVSLFVGFLDPLVAAITNPSESNLCRNASGDDFDTEMIILGFVLVVFLVMMVIYLKIYLTVRKLVRQHRMLTQEEINSYKAIITTFLILGTFVLCWLPYCIYQIVMLTLVHVNSHFLHTHIKALIFINDFLFLLFLFNSLCDPIIYAVRLGQVQAGYKRMLFKCFPQYRYSSNEHEFRTLQTSENGSQ